MMQWLDNFVLSLKKFTLLNGFWKTRTTFYRDLAASHQNKEQPKDFVAGELAIALARQTQDKNKVKGLTFMQGVMDGSDLSLDESLKAVMPKGDALALGTLKEAKNIPQALRELAVNIEAQQEMTKMVRSALFSPTILLPVAYLLAYTLSSRLMPVIAKAAPAEVWTPSNAAVRDSAAFVTNYGHWMLTLTALALLWIFVWALPNWTSPWRYRMENASGWERLLWVLVFPFQPIFALYRDIQGARLLGNLANLMQSGAQLNDALITLAENAEPWMRRHIAMILEHLDMAEGDHVGAFSHGVLPKFLLGRMGTLVRQESQGKFHEALITLGTTGMSDARKSVAKSAIKLNVFLLAGVFAVIAWFYGGFMNISNDMTEANSQSSVMRRQKQRSIQTQPVSAPASSPVNK